MAFVGRAVVVFAVVGSLAADAWPQAREPHTYMKKLGFSEAEIADMDAGKEVSRIVPEPDDNEASVVGVVRINAREEALVEGIRRIETFRNGDPVLQIGRFGTPPGLEDLRPLVFEAQDLDDLSRCKVGDCDVKVGTRALELARKVDWKAPDARVRASQLIKEAMVQLAAAYLDQGSSAMAVYNDNDVPESVAAEVDKILQNSPNLMRYNPEFLAYLRDFPKGTLPNVESFLYWSKEKVRKPVVSVAHVCIQKVMRGEDTGYFIAIKHVYDSHYFLANTEFLTLVPEGGERKGFYLVHFIRARVDPPRKFRGTLLGKVKGAMRDALDADLGRTKARLEAAEKH